MVEGDSTGARAWVPLESNPDVFNAFMRELGLEGDAPFFVDVFSLTDDWDSVPRPVQAVVACYPVTKDGAGTETSADPAKGTHGLLLCAQTVNNACGTMALLHALLNAPDRDRFRVRPGSSLERFRAKVDAPDLTPQQRAAVLEADASLAEAHARSAATGQSSVPSADADVDMHFVTLTLDRSGTQLYELDGRKPVPICHGASSRATLLPDACARIREVILPRAHDDLRLTVMALCGVEGA
ncbi:hypothetical protein CDCA_CDCA03G1139 [Cyanidium caldarium]|uniref:Ubiquitin carboxyl-terminal hydrolase n=1 Tax=Cyanidium caldarium TaxID=2771 RepID=A0AAV9ISI4_CYACA|nr:hypothetical protein CDCA_CDCA03G1139 [Cyanidium caldarium]